MKFRKGVSRRASERERECADDGIYCTSEISTRSQTDTLVYTGRPQVKQQERRYESWYRSRQGSRHAYSKPSLSY